MHEPSLNKKKELCHKTTLESGYIKYYGRVIASYDKWDEYANITSKVHVSCSIPFLTAHSENVLFISTKHNTRTAHSR